LNKLKRAVLLVIARMLVERMFDESEERAAVEEDGEDAVVMRDVGRVS